MHPAGNKGCWTFFSHSFHKEITIHQTIQNGFILQSHLGLNKKYFCFRASYRVGFCFLMMQQCYVTLNIYLHYSSDNLSISLQRGHLSDAFNFTFIFSVSFVLKRVVIALQLKGFLKNKKNPKSTFSYFHDRGLKKVKKLGYLARHITQIIGRKKQMLFCYIKKSLLPIHSLFL